jgi:hypothetical protein
MTTQKIVLGTVEQVALATGAVGETATPVSASNPVPVSMAAVATGGATEAKQDTQITAEQAMQATLGATTGAAVVTDANGTIQQYLRGLIVKFLALIAQLPASLGGKTPALSLSVTPAVLTPFPKAAGLTTSPFGATGAAGDYMSHVILQPAAVGAGTTTIFNNATAVYVYTAGTLADLRPIVVPINALSVGGSWNITSGANMSATGFGTFT